MENRHKHPYPEDNKKNLVTLLKIAQLIVFSQTSERRCILLFDDLPAELDSDNQNKIMSILSNLNIQLFITAIESDQIICKYWERHKVFHVEHGCITEVKQDDSERNGII